MSVSLIIGNWKMHGHAADVDAILSEIKSNLNESIRGQIAICPPFPYIAQAASHLRATAVQWGAQDVSPCENGAHTGDVSASMLQDLGCSFVLVGHSERRAAYAESDAQIMAKYQMAHAKGLRPVLCVGETLAQRQAGQEKAIIQTQLAALAAIPDLLAGAIIAYEPVWAIGTGQSASPEQVQAMHQAIRQYLQAQVPGVRVQILYGGSVKAQNAATLLQLPDVDGALVGGAALNPQEFLTICRVGK